MVNYEKSGKTFIAYKGREFSKSDIQRKLKELCPPHYTIKTVFRDEYSIMFSKVVYDEYVMDRDPLYNGNTDILTVSGYNQTEIENAIDGPYDYYDIDDPDTAHRLINKAYHNFGDNVFEKLSQCMDFCSVIWDEKNEELIAGVTNGCNPFTTLYYGATKKNGELMFSNNEEALKDFCKDIRKMTPNTYMKNGLIYELDGRRFQKDNSFIRNNKENAASILEGLNALLESITSEAVRTKVEQNLEDYLNSDDPKKRLSDYIVKELDGAIKKQVLEIIKNAIDSYQVEKNVENTLKSSFDKVLEDYTKTISVPVSHNIYLGDNRIITTPGQFYHEKFPQILRQTHLDEPIMLIGPAGSGKNVAVAQVAKSLGLQMFYTNNASNEFKLTGFIDAGGNYRETEFYKAFKNGGVFFLDEIDNSDPSALIVINSALANGYMAFPHETIDRHPDFRMIAAANTWGKGADLQYVGRNALDAATLDRFDNIFFDYDRKLEEGLYPNEEVLKFMWAFRDAVLKTKIPHIVSTRGIGKVYKKEINGIPVEDILTSNVVKNLSQDDLNTIIGNMSNINSGNKFFEGIKKLELRR